MAEIACPKCRGSGSTKIADFVEVCPMCRGTGTIEVIAGPTERHDSEEERDLRLLEDERDA